jgi:hypothetical protein
MRRTAAEIGAWWVLLLALDLVFVSTVGAAEAVAGAAAAALGAVGAWAVRRASGASPGGFARVGLVVWALPWAVVADTGRVVAAMVRRRPGVFRTVVLPPGVGPAWACGVLSTAPGAYVVGVGPAREDGSHRVRLHALSDEPGALERLLGSDGSDGAR